MPRLRCVGRGASADPEACAFLQLVPGGRAPLDTGDNLCESRGQIRISIVISRRIAPLVRILNGPDGVPCGRAAIGFGYIEAGIQSIGGLASSADTRAVHSFSMAYVGSMGFEPAGPRRNAGPIVGANVEGWASEQAALLRLKWRSTNSRSISRP